MYQEDDGIWRMEYTLRTGIQYVQLKIDDVEVVTPLLPITYGYSRPYNYVALEMKNEEFYQVKDVRTEVSAGNTFFQRLPESGRAAWYTLHIAMKKKQERRIPVNSIIFSIGHGENEIGWTASGKVNFILDNLIAEKKAVPMVIVMSNGMVQTVTEKGERIVDFKLLETSF